MIDHPALQDYVQGLWARIHASLRADLQREDSALVGHLQRSLASLGSSLQADPALREALNQHLLEGAQRPGALREGVTTHIAQTVKRLGRAAPGRATGTERGSRPAVHPLQRHPGGRVDRPAAACGNRGVQVLAPANAHDQHA